MHKMNTTVWATGVVEKVSKSNVSVNLDETGYSATFTSNILDSFGLRNYDLEVGDFLEFYYQAEHLNDFRIVELVSVTREGRRVMFAEPENGQEYIGTVTSIRFPDQSEGKKESRFGFILIAQPTVFFRIYFRFSSVGESVRPFIGEGTHVWLKAERKGRRFSAKNVRLYAGKPVCKR